MMNTNLMQVLIQFDQMDDGLFSLSRAIDLDIEGVKTASQLLKAVKMLAVFLLGQEGSKESVEAIERYFTRVENPSALLIWATRQHEFAIKSPAPGRLNLPLMEKVSSWLIYDDPTVTIRRTPYVTWIESEK